MPLLVRCVDVQRFLFILFYLQLPHKKDATFYATADSECLFVCIAL